CVATLCMFYILFIFVYSFMIYFCYFSFFFFFSSRRRHTRSLRDWSSDVCSSDLRGWPHEVDRDHAERNRAEKWVLAMVLAIGCPVRAYAGRQPRPASDRRPAARSEGVARPGGRATARSEERRVGKECRSRWSQKY